MVCFHLIYSLAIQGTAYVVVTCKHYFISVTVTELTDWTTENENVFIETEGSLKY